jgi:hypothetical protein
MFLFKGLKTRDAPGFSPRHYAAPVAMALYIQGSDIPIPPINRMCPLPKRGLSWRKGGAGRSIQQEISHQNMTIPKKHWFIS